MPCARQASHPVTSWRWEASLATGLAFVDIDRVTPARVSSDLACQTFSGSSNCWEKDPSLARGEDLDHGGNDDNGGFRHLPEDDGHTPMVAFPASNKV